MKLEKAKSINFKVISLYIILTLVSIIFITTIIYENQVDLITANVKLESEKKINGLINALNKLAVNFQKSYKKKKSKSIYNEIISIIKPLTSNYIIFSEKGKIYFKSDKSLKLPPKYIQDGLSSITQKTFGGKSHIIKIDHAKQSMYFYVPLNDFGLDNSILFIPKDLSILDTKMHTLYKQSIYVIIILIFIHAAFILLYFKKIMRPIDVLQDCSNEITKGNFTARINLRDDNEMGILAATFNRMAETIQDKIKELEKQMSLVKESKEKIEEMAITDELTKIYNRRYLMTRLNEEMQRAIRSKTSIGFIIADVDHFKSFNDTYGHQTGDLVLEKVAQVIKESCREIDIVARYGGEEFAIIAPDCPVDYLQRLSERLRSSVEKINVSSPQGVELSVTISIGAVSFNEPLLSKIPHGETLIAFADMALYRAKDNGRNCVVIG